MRNYFLFIFLLLSSSHFVWATQSKSDLLILTSQRNAETIAEAARLFYLANPKFSHLKITARTDSQLWALTPKQRARLIESSQAVLGFGLYGASVANLRPLLVNDNQHRLIMSSDHRLVALSQFDRKTVFDNSLQLKALAKALPGESFQQDLQDQLNANPAQSKWLMARAYWHAAGAENTAQLFAWMFEQMGHSTEVKPPFPTPQLRWYFNDEFNHQLPKTNLNKLTASESVIAIIDHAGGGRPADAKLLRQVCQQAQDQFNAHCLAALAYWGEAGVLAAKALLPLKDKLAAVVMLQDFVIGGGEGREQTTEFLQQLNVPVIKAIKVRDRSAIERKLSSDGLAQDKVYYQVAMPELQGASQPLVVATLGKPFIDQSTGIKVQGVVAEQSGITSVLTRINNWHKLKVKENKDKRVAIVYYNHPPGRHNIGADNLDVPASIWQILNKLKAEGYNTGKLPNSQEELLDLMQVQGVNLPRDSAALASMSNTIETMSATDYQSWFESLPETVKHEMEHGPFGLLHQQLTTAIEAKQFNMAEEALHHTVEEMHHLLEGVDHQGRERALALLEKLEHCYHGIIEKELDNACLAEAPSIITAIKKTGIEGLGGWGKAPGKVMTYNNEILLPGIQFGNVFIGPQPPRGWEINEELLHANLAFPPPHQYLAFYHFLKNKFKADALVHLGRHSTYEFLPRRSVGLAEDDYARIIAGDIPGVYPYIVDGVGEGIQAKRRGLAVMVDHLTPPLASTPLYDELLQLRQLIESFEANHGSDNELVADRLVKQIRDKVDALELKEELAQAMSAELAVMGISFEQVDDDMLVHEVGHYLTDLQERFMPLGLHVFGKDWQDDAINMMLESMLSKGKESGAPAGNLDADVTSKLVRVDKDKAEEIKANLVASPQAELTSLLNGLSGGFVSPGQGNDPIRSPASLPTGRNFYALDSSLIPSRIAWQLGKEMAETARANNPQNVDKSEAVILWASDVVRDEGVMIAFGLDMLGLEPIWNSRGLVKGLKHQERNSNENSIRRDIVFTTSGLFRDLYGSQMILLDKAVLMALDASSDVIRQDYPALNLALAEALNRLGKQAKGGQQPLSQNQVAAHWVKQAKAHLAKGVTGKDAGLMASYRVFGDAPGSYGAGINRLAERSGAWEKREELAQVYIRRIGHSYGLSNFGQPSQASFEQALSNVENTYFGRSSNLYGLIDNNDAFDYLGGLSLAIETITGSAPNNFVIDHADPTQVKTRPLGIALRQELRGRFLNPEWLKGQMKHGYAGARTMGSEFLEYLWGWQVTNPTLVGDWAWQEVKSVYMDDRYDLQLDEFLSQGHNAHVKANMLAVMLVAIHKEFWQASESTTQDLASEFAELVNENGLPGSGHTDFDNPMLPWLEQHLDAQQWQQLSQVIASAKGEQDKLQHSPEEYRVTEIHELDNATKAQSSVEKSSSSLNNQNNEANKGDENGEAVSDYSGIPLWQWWMLLAVLLFIIGGFYRGLQQSKQIKGE